MKNLVYILVFLSLVTSCDFILKDTDDIPMEKEIPEIGIAIAKDKNGCIEEAGYKWSIIKDNCIRVVDEGFRLNPISDLSNLEPAISAYVILDEKKLQAEVFLQDLSHSIYFKRNSESEDFKEKDFTLSLKSGFTLSIKDSIAYKAAITAIKPVVGSDLSDQ